MYTELSDIKSFTIKEFQSDFDNLIARVENGESFIITDGIKRVIIVPYNEIVDLPFDPIVDDELVRIHTDHEEGA